MYMVQLKAVDFLLANAGEMSQRRHVGLRWTNIQSREFEMFLVTWLAYNNVLINENTVLIFSSQCQCTDVVGKKDCVVDGLKYADGNRWTRDKCNICHCEVSMRPKTGRSARDYMRKFVFQIKILRNEKNVATTFDKVTFWT